MQGSHRKRQRHDTKPIALIFKYYSMNSGKNTDSQMRELGSPRTVLLGFVVRPVFNWSIEY